MRVDEAGQDRGVLELRSRSELSARADRGDAAVLDRDGPLLDRRALDRQNPVGGAHPVHRSVTLAGSPLRTRRSMSHESQIDACSRLSRGMATWIVVTRPRPGGATATDATMK